MSDQLQVSETDKRIYGEPINEVGDPLVSHDEPELPVPVPSVSIETDGEFAAAIQDAIQTHRPQRLLETGTHDGCGSTTVIAEAMESEARLMTIENDINFVRAARSNVERFWPMVHVRHGLSIPRHLLPKEAAILADIQKLPEGCAVDWPDLSNEERAKWYSLEADKPVHIDAMIRRCIELEFRKPPDFVMLDSAGHLGWIEFQYLMLFLKLPCVLALDDTKHLKHYRTLAFIEKDSRFKVVARGSERFGWVVAEFQP